MENQVYPSRLGQAVTVRYTDRTTILQKRGTQVTEFHFDITIDSNPDHVAVAVSRDASADLGRWLSDPAVLGTTEDRYVSEAAIDLCTARILEAIDRGIDFDEDAKAYPESFVRLFNGEVAGLIKKGKAPSVEIKDYIARRLQAAWDVGTGMIDWAQLFGRVDWLYLRVSERDLMKVIEAYNKKLWYMNADGPLLTPTDTLTETFVSGGEVERAQKTRQPDGPFQREGSAALRSLIGKVAHTDERDFLDEAIKCYDAQAYRAAIIMVWILTLDHLQEFILKHHLADFNIELGKVKDRRVKVTAVTTKDDFADIPESNFIEIARASKVISNDVRKILVGKLDIRNSYAHPSNITLSPIKASDFITDLTNNVVLKYPL